MTCELISKERLQELEPHANGVAAIHVPEAGIVGYKEVSKKLRENIEKTGGTIRCNTLVQEMSPCHDTVMVHTNQGEFQTKIAIACGGLQSDRLVRSSGKTPTVRIVPFRGEYYELTEDARHLCRNLIYPVPDPQFPFLGVHFTRMINGGVECGPNAVLSLSRRKLREVQAGRERFVFRHRVFRISPCRSSTLENGSGRSVAIAFKKRVCQGAAKACAGDSEPSSGIGRRRYTRTGSSP